MTSVFSWQILAFALLHSVLQGKSACYSRCFLTSYFCIPVPYNGASLVVQTVKRPPAMQETQVRSLGQEGLLEKEMAAHSNILAWRIPWTEEPGGLQSLGWTERLTPTHTGD